jgi:hypothetical protein
MIVPRHLRASESKPAILAVDILLRHEQALASKRGNNLCTTPKHVHCLEFFFVATTNLYIASH